MLERYKYSEQEVEKLCKSIVILCDTREKENKHITDWFDSQEIPWTSRALKQGDYSFYIPENQQLNIERDVYFDREIMVERKHNLDEIAGNFTKSRTRFEEEMAMAPKKKYLLLENSSYGDVIEKNYRSQFSAKAFLGSLHSFNHKYGLEIIYMPNPKFSGAWIYGTFFYYLKNLLR